jgi:tetratricopeptide (TPR) repeat protein
MINFYRELNVAQTAPEDEIRKAINRELRVWSNRTNAPQIERRQEAERMVKTLEDAEATLLDSTKRAEYDRQLRNAPAEAATPAVASVAEGEDLVKQGWNLLIMGNVPDALYVATKATEKDATNPEAWALLGQAKFRWGETDDAIYEYKRAINLRPNAASYYFDLGSVYESADRWSDALTQYQRASQIDPSSTMYRAAIGALLVRADKYKEAITILDQCVRDEPNNSTYQWFLAIAYTASSYENWTYVPEGQNVPEGYYATTRTQVEEATRSVEKAQTLKYDDPDLSAKIAAVKNNIQSMLKRRFHGNGVAAGAAIVLGLLSFANRGGSALGVYLILFAGLYIASCFTPQYVLNRKIIAGKGGNSGHIMAALLENEKAGCWLWLASLIIILALLPVMTGWNFLRNYAMA